MRKIHTSLLGLTILLAACGDEGGPATEQNDADTGGAGADSSAGSDASDVDTAEADRAIDTPNIDAARTLSDLTAPEIEALCVAQETYENSLDRPLREFWCLSSGVDAGQVGENPAFTCGRFLDPCIQLLDLEEQFPDLDPEPVTVVCASELYTRGNENCVDPTVGQYKACVLANIALQQTVVERGQMTCEEAVGMVSIEPEGLMDCACGIPQRLGPVPADDDDWDYVLNEEDLCPDSEQYLTNTKWGCTRYQDSDSDRVPDRVDQCLFTEVGASPVSAIGCSPTQDTDFDDIPNDLDRCPETEVGVEYVSPGCSATQDEDGDGYPNLSDWCPFTPAGGTVREGGCAEDQGQPWSSPFLDTLPEGVDSVVLGESADSVVNMHFLPSGVSEATDVGFRYTGSLLLEMPGAGFLPLPASDVRFEEISEVDGRVRAVSGTVPMPFPRLGLFELFKVGPTGACTIGLGYGDSALIQELGLPFADSRVLLFIECEAGFKASLGALVIDIVDDVEMLFALDVSDPAIFVRSNIEGIGPFRHIRDVAVGLSNQGLLEFEPEVTWGVENHARAFSGNVFLNGTLPIKTPLPSQIGSLNLVGTAVVDLDPIGDGIPEFDIGDARVGGNGVVEASVDLVPALPFTFSFAEAAMGIEYGDAPSLWISGQLGLDDIDIPSVARFDLLAPARGALYASTDIDQTYIVVEGNFEFRGSEIRLPLIPDMDDIVVNGRMELRADGVRVQGTVSGRLHDWVRTSGPVTLEVYIGWEDGRFSISLTGSLLFKDELEIGDIYFGDDDIRIDGESFSLF